MQTQSNVISSYLQLKIQRGATQPPIAFRFQQSDGSFLDLTTVYDVHIWFRNAARTIVAKLSKAEGLTIQSAPETTDNSLLVLHGNIQWPAGEYTFDVNIFLTETDNFFPIKGAAVVVEYISQ